MCWNFTKIAYFNVNAEFGFAILFKFYLILMYRVAGMVTGILSCIRFISQFKIKLNQLDTPCIFFGELLRLSLALPKKVIYLLSCIL